MIGKKGSGMEQIISVPPFDPNREMQLHDAELKNLIQHESAEHAQERRALHH